MATESSSTIPNGNDHQDNNGHQVATSCNKIMKIEPASTCIESTYEARLDFELFMTYFQETFNEKPQFIIWAPGRVNLIGEHIDYHGFSVLPIAIKQRIWMGLAINDTIHDQNQIQLANTCKIAERATWLGKHSLEYASKLASEHAWHNYFLCGYQGVLATEILGVDSDKLLESTLSDDDDQIRRKLSELPELKILVHSDLPAASGLSSSSALVCASTLATMLALRSQPKCTSSTFDRLQVANNCSEYEHLIGTQGGGMDQAIIMTAQRNYAKLVQFKPELKCDNVKLPSDIVWLVSHSGVDYPKAATSEFNTRVLETKMGATLIAQHHNLLDKKHDFTLGNLHDSLFSDWSTSKLIEHLRNEVFQNQDKWTIDEFCAKINVSRGQFATRFKVSQSTLECDKKLTLLSRCEHVFEEAERVQRFRSICDTTTNTVLLGQLMSQSHASLRDKYQCSHPALDRLVDSALEAGALGSRLTGAGWGGCVITMVEAAKSHTVLERLKDLSSFTFKTQPESGCQIMSLD